jgi:hypothetical protein
VRNGLVPRSPTDEQLDAGAQKILMKAGVWERLAYYARRPLLLFPTAKKRRTVQVSIKEIIDKGLHGALLDAENSVQASCWDDDPFLDRLLKWTFLFSPARFVTHFVFNPWVVVPTTGLNIPMKFHIAHILQTDHDFPLWDLQIIHPDQGALDELECQVDATLAGIGPRARLNRAIASSPGYFDYLKELIPRIRRFDYPPVPNGLNPHAVNLVTFLNYAATL